MPYYIIDVAECSVSWNEKTSKGEAFNSKTEAIGRAKQLATAEPGNRFEVVQAIIEVACQVNAPVSKNLL